VIILESVDELKEKLESKYGGLDMSLLNDNITEEIQKKIYVITAKLGVVPSNVKDYGDKDVQVNWIVDDKSYMWRSLNHGNVMEWVEVMAWGSDPYYIDIVSL
tara:strand:- start:226 stop:534 length:309 start_codon:yes stop_codon:yes gene_type:complete